MRRARAKAAGVARPAGEARSGKSGAGGRKASSFRDGVFVAIDGEGFSEGAPFRYEIGDNRRVYEGREHFYALLAASDGSEIYAPEGRLGSGACLDFLLDVKRNNPQAILVCFGGSYDATQMLCHGLSREDAKRLLTDPDPEDPGDRRQRRTLDVSFGCYDYRLEYRARKSLSIWRWDAGKPKYERKTIARGKRAGEHKWVSTAHASAVLWDVWGFFQGTFLAAMDDYLPGHPDYETIKREKANRSVFARSEIDIVRAYNKMELRCLVAMMEKVRGAIADMGLTISRWDGAGAVAAAMMAHHKVRDHMAKTPDIVFDAARHAYSGGHIEVCRIGFHDGPVYHYDLNSAYPSVFRDLPSLAEGVWRKGTGTPPAGFTLCRVRFAFRDRQNFYPLFFRDDGGSIFYPREGEGWYWYPEYEAAREYSHCFGSHDFTCVEWLHYYETRPARPFHWIESYYDLRQSLVAESKRTGVPNGLQMMIKLGLNSLYGKTAQQVGAREVDGEIVPPPYFQLEWAGYVTAGCRAAMMQAAIQNPVAIVGFATDGLYSTEPLDLPCPAEKILGAWEYKEHAGMTMVMPGVYWLHEADGRTKHFSRGFDKKKMGAAGFVLDAWKWRRTRVDLTVERLIGLGTAIISEDFWAMRGAFVKSRRDLRLDGGNSKRYPVPLTVARPWQGLVYTVPREHNLSGIETEFFSAPYPVAWVDDAEETDIPADPHEGWEADREEGDAELA